MDAAPCGWGRMARRDREERAAAHRTHAVRLVVDPLARVLDAVGVDALALARAHAARPVEAALVHVAVAVARDARTDQLAALPLPRRHHRPQRVDRGPGAVGGALAPLAVVLSAVSKEHQADAMPQPLGHFANVPPAVGKGGSTAPIRHSEAPRALVHRCATRQRRRLAKAPPTAAVRGRGGAYLRAEGRGPATSSERGHRGRHGGDA